MQLQSYFCPIAHVYRFVFSTLIVDCTVLKGETIQTHWLINIESPARGSFSQMETSKFSLKGCKMPFISAFMVFEQGGIFIVPHLLWHAASVLRSHPKDRPHSVASYNKKVVLRRLPTGRTINHILHQIITLSTIYYMLSPYNVHVASDCKKYWEGTSAPQYFLRTRAKRWSQ
jgi:hypothetical protein